MINPALGITNLVCVVSASSNTQSLTHAAVGRGPIWFLLSRQRYMVAHPCPINIIAY